MSIRDFFKYLSSVVFIRRYLFLVLSRFNFKVSIPNSYSGRSLLIESWLHRSYWFFQRNRERTSMNLLPQLINQGDTVLEIGAHIGFMTQYFEFLTGDRGCVVAVEPTPESFVYLKRNALPSSILISAAISSSTGISPLFIGSQGGFTNSLSRAFVDEHHRYAIENGGLRASKISLTSVATFSIDDLFSFLSLQHPRFIKIDAEGAELKILQGASNTLPNVQYLMIEITSSHREIASILEDNFLPLSLSLTPGSWHEFLNQCESRNHFFLNKRVS